MIFITPEERKSRYRPHKSIYELERAYDLHIPEVKPLIQIDGNTLLTRDNLMVIGGRAKSGKTYVISALIASAIFDLDTRLSLGFNVSKIWQYDNIWEHKHVLHFDTEQQEPEYKSMLNDICRRRGNSYTIPDYFCSYSLSDKSIADIFPFIQKTCEFYSTKHGGIHLIFIDNLTDLIESVNDEKIATNIIRELCMLAKKHECGIVGVIHENEKSMSGNGLRGHIGSQAQRKSQSVLFVNKEREEDFHAIDFPIMRSGNFKNKVKFVYDSQLGTMCFDSVITDKNILVSTITINESKKDMIKIFKDLIVTGDTPGIHSMFLYDFHSEFKRYRGGKEDPNNAYSDAFLKSAEACKLISIDGGNCINFYNYV